MACMHVLQQAPLQRCDPKAWSGIPADLWDTAQARQMLWGSKVEVEWVQQRGSPLRQPAWMGLQQHAGAISGPAGWQ